MPETSISLLDRLRHSPDEPSWRRLVDLYRPFFRGWLASHQVPHDDLDDLEQDVLHALVRHLPQFEHNGRPGAFRCWLRALLVNRLREHWRARRRQPIGSGESDDLAQLEQLEAPDSPLSRLWDEEHNQFVIRRLLELSESRFTPATLAAFRKLVFEDKTSPQVAAEMGLSENAVLIAKSRVLRYLREESAGLVDFA